MVKGHFIMLIGEFALRAGLSQDTVRFYVRKGMLKPETSFKGGRNPYQLFNERDVSTAKMIRFAQSLGMSLREIAEIASELMRDGLSARREAEIIDDQLGRLEQKAADLAQLIGYLKEKRVWISNGKIGEEPHFDQDIPCLSSILPDQSMSR